MSVSKPSRLFRSTVVSMGVLSALAIASKEAEACGADAYTGQVCIMAGSYCPAGTVETNGQITAITDNTALFSLIGCTYGGDCRNSMGMPDIRGRAPVHYGTGPGLTGHAWGTSFGDEEVTQDITQLPVHNHTAVFTETGSSDPVKLEASLSPGESAMPSAGDHLGISLGGDLYVSSPGPLVELGGISGGTGGTGTVTVNNTGQGLPMPNVPPEIALRYCVVTQGIYPPRT